MIGELRLQARAVCAPLPLDQQRNECLLDVRREMSGGPMRGEGVHVVVDLVQGESGRVLGVLMGEELLATGLGLARSGVPRQKGLHCVYGRRRGAIVRDDDDHNASVLSRLA